ncbi:NAD-dependent epimerase/dehydratase family protein [Thermodesulfobacteriota bacterium]
MILVTGGAGVMGSRLVKGLVYRGYKVRVLTLPGDPKASLLDDVDCEIVYGDVSDADSIEAIFLDIRTVEIVYGDVSDADSIEAIFLDIRTVYHLASVIIAQDPEIINRVNVQGTRNVVGGAGTAGVGHFVYVSSASVTWPEGSDYARSKLAAEKIVMSQRTMSWTIVRPTLTYGRDEGQEFMLFMDYLKKSPVVPFIGRGQAKRDPVLADDVVSGLLKIAGNPQAYGKIYNFSGGEEISIWELAKLMLKVRGMTRVLLPIPVPVCHRLRHGKDHETPAFEQLWHQQDPSRSGP